MLNIRVENKHLEIPSGQTFTLVKNSELFSTDLPEGEYSYPINLSLKSKNVAVFFNHLAIIQAVKNFKSVKCQLYFKNAPFENDARLIFRKTRNSMIQGYILTGSSILAQALRKTKVNEIDYGSFDTGDGQQDMVDHMLDTVQNYTSFNHVFGPVVTPFFNENYSGVKNVLSVINYYSNHEFLQSDSEFIMNKNNFVPFLKLKFVLEKVFENFGFTLEWELMNNVDFQKIVVVNNAELAKYIDWNGCKVSSFNTREYELQETLSGNPNLNNNDEQILEINNLNDQNIFFFTTSFENDTNGSNYNDLGLFITAGGTFLPIVSNNAPYKIRYKMHFQIEETAPGQYDDYSYNRYYILFDIFAQTNGTTHSEFLGRIIKEVPFSINSQIGEKEITLNIPNEHVGKNMVFKSTIIAQGAWGSVGAPGDGWFRPKHRITFEELEINFEDKPINFKTLENVIEYKNHLPGDDCSTFLNTIRKRFGAYVSDIDFVEKSITFRQKNDVLKNNNAKVNFKHINNENEMEVSFHTYLFTEEFEGDNEIEELGINPALKELKVGSTEDDAEENAIELKYSPILNKINAPNTCGFNGIVAGSAPANIRLAFFHGLKPGPIPNIDIPFVSSDNFSLTGQKIAGYNLFLNKDEYSLWTFFWKKWYEKFYEKEKYIFEIYPILNEITKYKLDNMEYYEQCNFVAEKVEFKIRGNKLLKSKYEVVKKKV